MRTAACSDPRQVARRDYQWSAEDTTAPGLAHTGVAGAASDVDPKERAFTEVRFIISLHGDYPARD